MYSQMRKILTSTLLVLLMAVVFIIPMVPTAQAAGSYPADYAQRVAHYNSHEKPIINSLRSKYQGSLAEAIAGRAIWYMEYGYTVYGHTLYAKTGYIDCSQFVFRAGIGAFSSYVIQYHSTLLPDLQC